MISYLRLTETQLNLLHRIVDARESVKKTYKLLKIDHTFQDLEALSDPLVAEFKEAFKDKADENGWVQIEFPGWWVDKTDLMYHITFKVA
jgi:hypothetical protein